MPIPSLVLMPGNPLLTRRRRRVYLSGPFRFAVDAAAPLGSPYTEAGAKSLLTLVQTDGEFSKSGGKLVFPAQTTPTVGDQGIYDAAFTRRAGRAFFWDLRVSSDGAASSGHFAGWATGTALSSAQAQEAASQFWTDGNIYVGTFGTDQYVGSFALDTDYQFAYVLRGTGSYLFVRGGAYTSWTLLWVRATGATASLRPSFSNADAVGTLDNWRVTDLGGAFASDYGLATTRLSGSVAEGTTFVHTKDALLYVGSVTLPSADSIKVAFREQDANNYWTLEVSSSGALSIVETVAGTPTTRATDAGVVANGERIAVVFDGAVIKSYEVSRLRGTYGSAATFLTATAGRVLSLGTGGVVTDLECYPRRPAFPAAA